MGLECFGVRILERRRRPRGGEPSGPAQRPGRAPWAIDAAWMLAIGLLALGLRLAYAIQFTTHPLGLLLYVDEIVYWERARSILGGSWLPGRPFFQDPLIQYLLAGLMALVGTRVAALRLALASLGALTPMATYWAGRRGLGRAEAVIAGLALAIYGPLVFADGQLEKEGVGALLAALALAAVAHADGPGRGVAPAAMAGVLWGAVALLRGNALLAGPIGLAWWLVGPRRPWATRRAGAAGFLVGFLAALAPASLINAYVSPARELILSTSQAGAMFYTGNGPEADGVGDPPRFIRADPHVEGDEWAAEAIRRAGRPLTPGEVSSFWMREGIRRWREAPIDSLRLLAFKFGLVLNDAEIPDSQSFDCVRRTVAPVLRLDVLSFGWLAPWAAVGLLAADRRPFRWFLAATTVVGLASTPVFFVIGRYRIPWTPGLALLAACGAVDLARRLAARRWREAAWRVVLVGAPMAALAWRPGADPHGDRWEYFQLGLFISYLEAGEVDAAIDVLDDLRAMNPRAEPLPDILEPGRVHDLFTRTIARSWAAAVSGSRPPAALARLARALPETHAKAAGLLDEAERVAPDDPVVWRERGGWWLARTSDRDARARAVAAYRRASGDPSARIALALLTSDPGLLEIPSTARPERIRLARAVLAQGRARPGPGRRARVPPAPAAGR